MYHRGVNLHKDRLHEGPLNFKQSSSYELFWCLHYSFSYCYFSVIHLHHDHLLTTLELSHILNNTVFSNVFFLLICVTFCCWHTCLLYKLSKSMPYWFTRLVGLLLQDRRFRVHMGNAPVLGRPECNGLPQCSVLAPVLSNLYSNDLPLHMAENSFTLAPYVSPFKANTSALSRLN